jgi:pimeloyl-[acyl-carrier protein] methyl ester esterase
MTRTTAASVFLPGWGFGKGPVEMALAGGRWRARALPGSGAGEIPPVTFTDARDMLLAALPPVCHLGGWSLGAMLALACAIAAPKRILGLFLMSATPCFVRRSGWTLGRPPAELRALRRQAEADGPAILPDFSARFCEDQAGRATGWLLEHADPMPTSALVAGLTWLLAADLREEAHCVTCPVTLLHGEEDTLIPPQAAYWLADRLPHARLVLLPGRAHAPFAVDAAHFLRELSP